MNAKSPAISKDRTEEERRRKLSDEELKELELAGGVEGGMQAGSAGGPSGSDPESAHGSRHGSGR